MARRMNFLTNLSYMAPQFLDKRSVRHVTTFVNCLPSLANLRVLLVPSPSSISGLSDAELSNAYALVIPVYRKFVSIVRSKGSQRLRRFIMTDRFKEDLLINGMIIRIADIITTELVGWTTKGDGLWELKEEVGKVEGVEGS